jgi:transposase-like protein
MAIKSKMNLPTLNVDFDTDTECREALEGLRWPDGVKCLRCWSDSISRITTRKQYDCNACRYRFSVTTGTIFNDSHLALPKWFMAVLIMCEAKKGISANQIKRTLGVAHKTAWYLCHRIRVAMAEVNAAKLTGTVEVDETYIGGGRGVGQGNRDRHKMILAAIERGGMVRMQYAKSKRANRETLHGFIKSNVDDDCANIYTDEARGYNGIGDHNTTHQTVKHSAGEYVRGDVHTNTVESVFGLFKRSIVGSFHQISEKHLDLYLDEFEFRFNNRKNPYLFRDTITRLVQGKSVPYEKLTA